MKKVDAVILPMCSAYATPSNFIAMFERSFGDSPARYFAQRGELR